MSSKRKTTWLQTRSLTQHISIGAHEGKILVFQRNAIGHKCISIFTGDRWCPCGYYYYYRKEKGGQKEWMAKKVGIFSETYQAKSEEDAIAHLLERV